MKEVQLYTDRDFGKNIDTSFKFFRENFVDIFKSMFWLLLLPIGGAFLVSLTEAKTYNEVVQEIVVTIMNNGSLERVIGLIPTSTYIFVLLIMISSYLSTIYVVAYMGVYADSKDDEPVDSSKVWAKVLSSALPLLVVFIITYILVLTGCFFCFLPGIFLMISLGFGAYTYINEDVSIWGAITRSYQLVKNNWWNTFGFIMIIGIIVGIASNVFQLPMMLSSLGIVTSPIYMIVTMSISLSVNLLLNLFSNVAMGVYYYSLREQKDGLGMDDRIASLGEETEF